jgi:hypothetical protein
MISILCHLNLWRMSSCMKLWDCNVFLPFTSAGQIDKEGHIKAEGQANDYPGKDCNIPLLWPRDIYEKWYKFIGTKTLCLIDPTLFHFLLFTPLVRFPSNWRQIFMQNQMCKRTCFRYNPCVMTQSTQNVVFHLSCHLPNNFSDSFVKKTVAVNSKCA